MPHHLELVHLLINLIIVKLFPYREPQFAILSLLLKVISMSNQYLLLSPSYLQLIPTP